MGLQKVDNIYFTRTLFSNKDVGEWEIERAFKENGYTIMSPERLSLAEQVFYINNASKIASLSGTICHNLMFARPDTKAIILNRFHGPIWAQYRINHIFKLDIVLIDVYHKFRSYPKYDDSNKVWVEFSDALKSYFIDQSMKLPKIGCLSNVRNYFLYVYQWTIKPLLRRHKSRISRYCVFVKNRIVNA